MKQVRISNFIIVLFLAFLVFSTNANADLYVRGTDSLGNQLIYDDDLNITWYDYSAPASNANVVKMWANQLSVNFDGIIFNDWRLPIALNSDGSPCADYNPWCPDSEMMHLYYEELFNPSGGPMINTGPFGNLTETRYWLETEGLDAYVFETDTGRQSGEWSRHHNFSGMAVRVGDVSVVPILIISPPSGDYVTTQGFDLVLIVELPSLSIVGGTATIDGTDVKGVLVNCIIPGTLTSGGQTFRCPGIVAGNLATGTHTVNVSLDLSNGSSINDSVIWEVRENTEP